MSDTDLSVRQCRWDLNPIPSNSRVQCHCPHTGLGERMQAWNLEHLLLALELLLLATSLRQTL